MASDSSGGLHYSGDVTVEITDQLLTFSNPQGQRVGPGGFVARWFSPCPRESSRSIRKSRSMARNLSWYTPSTVPMAGRKELRASTVYTTPGPEIQGTAPSGDTIS